ncbi:hypothetical protein J5N97_014298 [Dioscorea zingiberensis]|uniref:BTB domain-containing protein n=1 Tax=Dioscorea zingiberensis TaxID=325984 RepID=A0A9D5CTV5_9LILI|nr:hypothetical protein J5N97_014298 [Dioscorea zingiberensis]
MEGERQQQVSTAAPRKGQKRKLEDPAVGTSRALQAYEFEGGDEEIRCQPPQKALDREVKAQVEVLERTFSWRESDRAAAKRATHVLAELAKNEEVVNVIVDGGAVPALVEHLQEPPPLIRDGCAAEQRPFEHEVEKGSAFALGLLAVKPEHQQLIVDAGALPLLVDLLKRHKKGPISRAVNSVIRRAADAITNLAHENSNIKTFVRIEGGIPPLVELLEFTDVKVQRAAAGALRTLAFKNDENKNQIVECNALPTLILMLRSEDAAIHYEAVGVIGNLVHSSPNIKKEVLLAGALQPVIGLLSSCCGESQREAALLLGQFAATDPDCKVHIVQRGAVRPLIEMLQSLDIQLKEMAAFALGRLAQVYLGEQYVNNATLSDVTFLVEGKRFYMHRIALLASSDAFRAMFDGGYREKDARDIEIPNIKWEVFELMMRVSSCDKGYWQDLLRAADQYLLEGLKRLCEYSIAQDVSLENVSNMYELSEAFHAMSLRRTCVLFILEHFEKISVKPGPTPLIQRIIPEIRNFFSKALRSNPRGYRP